MIHMEFVFLKLLVLSLGLAVAFVAYRAYKRYQSRPLLFVALGFAFISLGDGLEGVLMYFTSVSHYQAGLVHTVFMIAGMACVLYSIYGGSGTITKTTQEWREHD